MGIALRLVATSGVTKLKPSTWKNIQQRLEENMRYMNSDDTLQDEYNRIESENETMGWISLAEGKNRAFEKYEERIAIQIQAEEDGID